VIVKGGLLALPGGTKPVRADILSIDGVISEIGTDLSHSGHEAIDADGLLVLPGAIDAHVHFNEPGYTDREDFYHGTSAAASGGVTTVVDMPCTSVPPVTSLKNLEAKLAVVSSRAVIDYGFHGGVSGRSFERNVEGLVEELADQVLGFKCYFVSGMETFPALSHPEFEEALALCRAVNRPVLLHAEDAGSVAVDHQGDGPIDYYRSRPEEAEIIAVRYASDAADRLRARLHIVHVSTGEAARVISSSPHTTGETAPHYLAFTLADFDRIGSALKVTPPVKPAGNRDQLWAAIADGSLSFVASDHAPAPPEQKSTGSIWSDYSGIPGSPTLLPYCYSAGYVEKRISLARLLQITSEAAARQYGLSRKGSLEPGKDADLVMVDPGESWVVSGAELLSKGTVTPFEGMRLSGRVEKTIVRGTVVYDRRNGIVVEPGYGVFQRKGER
jgi:allantoinase